MTLGSRLESVVKAAGGVMARRITGSAPRILMYHRFADADRPRHLSRHVFEQHLDYLTRHFRVRRLDDVVGALREGRPLEPRTVVLTVDDGYADFVEYAYPLLQKYEVPATLFVVSDFLDRNAWLWTDAIRYALDTTTEPRLVLQAMGVRLKHDLTVSALRERAWLAVCDLCLRAAPAKRAWLIERLQQALNVALSPGAAPDYRAMSWQDARRLDSGLVEIGSHTCTHPVLSRCSAPEIDHELGESKRVIEQQLRRSISSMAYPHGEPTDYDHRVVRAAQAAGYQCAVVAHGGPIGEEVDLFRLERLSAATEITQFRSTVNGLELLANRFRAWRHAAAF
jgi:peptidoglycan/xylan/chitin deacetylase (PgdA/CDA1 family)